MDDEDTWPPRHGPYPDEHGPGETRGPLIERTRLERASRGLGDTLPMKLCRVQLLPCRRAR